MQRQKQAYEAVRRAAPAAPCTGRALALRPPNGRRDATREALATMSRAFS